jgi:uncharacterized protein YgiM (DUF1202 family)
MKTNYWLVLGTMIAASAIAQNNTNTLPEMPAPVTSPAAEMAPAPAAATNTPTAAPVKHKQRAAAPAKAVALKEPTVALVAGPAEVTVSNLITRGQAGLKGEIIAHLFKGDTVTVLSQINLDKHAAGEPAQWAKIAYPTNAHVWVNAKYIDAANNVVSARKLNLRAGPGENYNVVGVLERGAPVSQVSTKDAWMKIGAPTNAYAFVAAMYLKQVAPAPIAAAPAPAETEPTPMPTPVPEAQPIVTEPINPPPAVAAPEPAAVDTNVPPPPPRVATHEGVVRHVSSLITPTEYELYDPTTDKNVNFLYTTTTNLDLSRYVGMRIIVTGEEGLAARWADIPVLTIQRILVIDTNAAPKLIYRSPRAAGQRR